MLKQDRIAGTIILLVCTGLFYEGWHYPNDSRIFPLGLLIFLMIGAIMMIARPAETSGKKQEGTKRVFFTICLCLAYVALVDFIGYFVTTALFMTCFMAMMGLRSIPLYVTTIVGVNVGLYLLFVWQLKVPVPMGLLFQ